MLLDIQEVELVLDVEFAKLNICSLKEDQTDFLFKKLPSLLLMDVRMLILVEEPQIVLVAIVLFQQQLQMQIMLVFTWLLLELVQMLAFHN